MSSSSTASSARDDASSTDPSSLPQKLTKVPIWIPISAFIGTSLALAIPLLMLRRRGITKLSLKDASAPPPRRAQPGATVPQTSASSTAVSSSEPVVTSLRTEIETPSVGEMMSALSKMNASSALLAAKAFGIATALVVAGGAGIAWSVRTTMDVHDVRDFGQKMRYLMWKSMPDLTSRILRPPEFDEQHRHVALHALEDVPLETWSWEQSQKRLQRAYDEGGFMLWAQMALREMELEARVEREKRERHFGKEKDAVA
ncbi:hypothetical protein BDN70DRAFT_882959 [Pholiota conissans]|uniref:Uncharacterized protein n=1 Tax=Pholiota conissans TaxID=109636 RepID=A0A9P6CRC4_9AGAR|nr:hypothetical protein BDN70DRAFT_882959 [Pholiota conissans]